MSHNRKDRNGPGFDDEKGRVPGEQGGRELERSRGSREEREFLEGELKSSEDFLEGLGKSDDDSRGNLF